MINKKKLKCELDVKGTKEIVEAAFGDVVNEEETEGKAQAVVSKIEQNKDNKEKKDS